MLYLKKNQREQTYDEECVKLGFIQYPSVVTKPQCLLCLKALAYDAMKRHLIC